MRTMNSVPVHSMGESWQPNRPRPLPAYFFHGQSSAPGVEEKRKRKESGEERVRSERALETARAWSHRQKEGHGVIRCTIPTQPGNDLSGLLLLLVFLREQESLCSLH